MSLTHIETIELDSSQASITFSSIPQDYDDLVLKVSSRHNAASVSDSTEVEFNSDTTSGNYSHVRLQGNGSSASTFTAPAELFFFGNGDNSTANTYNSAEVYISNYTSSSNKSYSSDSAQETNASQAFSTILAGLYTTSSAITQIKLTSLTGSDIMSGSTFSLYGVTAGGDGTVTTS